MTATKGHADIKNLVEDISRRRKSVEEQHAKINADHARLVRDNKELEKEKRVLLQEIRLLRDIIKEQKLRKELEALYAHVTDEKDLKLVALMPAVAKKADAVSSNGRKRPIKTMLHSILEATNERGKIRSKELARELGVEEKLLREWTTIMSSRGMIKASYSLRGELILEKMPAAAAPA